MQKSPQSISNRRISRKITAKTKLDIAYTPIKFETVTKKASLLVKNINTKMEALVKILLKYESNEVAQDEISRTLDLLNNLSLNKEYFKLHVGEVTTFLPRNQPLYAFSCFVIVPSLMASEVHVRVPHSMGHFFHEILSLLEINSIFSNIFVSKNQRLDFLKKRSALRINTKTAESKPVSDVVIFTGTTAHAEQLRTVFDKRTLFIMNGSGHNPIIISDDANLEKAVDAVVDLQFYNQGQDCAAPNAILVSKKIYTKFMPLLLNKVKKLKVGNYVDTSCRIGPISDPKDIVKIQEFLIDHRPWIHPSTPGIIRSHEAIIEPTIISKPLANGGNFHEIFAPIIFVQKYENDTDLKGYFEDKHYALHAMYVTVYGNSNYVKDLTTKYIGERILHRKDTILNNTHLHITGVERGIQPYGGYGYGSSSISIDGKIIPLPTLPQRDIYNYIVKPASRLSESIRFNNTDKKFIKIEEKNVEKLLRLKHEEKDITEKTLQCARNSYIDKDSIKSIEKRYIKMMGNIMFSLLEEPNIELITTLGIHDIKHVQSLSKLLKRRSIYSFEKFSTSLYAIPLNSPDGRENPKLAQMRFFQNIYRLLFDKNFGPKLTVFLWEIEPAEINHLLDV